MGDLSRTNLDQLAVRDGLYKALVQAFENGEISWSNCVTEDRGDGALILVPPEMPKSLLVSKIPAALVDAVSMHNEACPERARMRLRMALHAGEIHCDAHGFAGTAINHLIGPICALTFRETIITRRAVVGSRFGSSRSTLTGVGAWWRQHVQP